MATQTQKKLSIFSILLIGIGAVFALNVLVLGFLFLTGKKGRGSKICEEKAVIKNQQIMEKITYEIPSTSRLGKGLILEVEDWGDWHYRHPTIDKSENTEECEAVSLVEDATHERPASHGTIISIGENLNVGYKAIVTMNIDLYVYANPKTNESYNMEKLINDIAKRYELVNEPNGVMRLRFRPEQQSLYSSTIDDTSYIRGNYIFQIYNKKKLQPNYRFVDLFSADGGETWSVEPRL